ncbi:hypothetical protein QUB63_13545 [Microcoleus sp. ARI1-B5]|uniref:hypothetical protein n=1 Tax=unclassified Microcoleus TaxID=2642155 RepID=UPI002FD76C60
MGLALRPIPQEFQEMGLWGEKAGFYEFCEQEREIYKETRFLGSACDRKLT